MHNGLSAHTEGIIKSFNTNQVNNIPVQPVPANFSASSYLIFLPFHANTVSARANHGYPCPGIPLGVTALCFGCDTDAGVDCGHSAQCCDFARRAAEHFRSGPLLRPTKNVPCLFFFTFSLKLCQTAQSRLSWANGAFMVLPWNEKITKINRSLREKLESYLYHLYTWPVQSGLECQILGF